MNLNRIAYVITDLETGGVPLHLLRLAMAMRKRGFDPHVISLAHPGPVSAQLEANGITAHACDAAGPADLTAIWKLARILKRTRPTLVHSFLFHANVATRVAMPLAGLSYRRLICEIQTVEIERPWHLIVGGMTHRFSHCVVGNSKSVVRHLHRRAHMAASRLRCIPGGVDIDAIRGAKVADRVSLGVTGDEPVLLWVGRIDPVKGLDELIGAFARIVATRPATLLLAGDGTHAEHVRTLIRKNDLDERVRMLGRRRDVASLMKVADVFVFPSHTEGMPNVLLEAMAANLPIVTTDVPGCTDLIEHQRTGLLVPPRDTPALAAAIDRLLTDPALARRLGRSAASRVQTNFTLNQSLNRYESLYRGITGGTSQKSPPR